MIFLVHISFLAFIGVAKGQCPEASSIAPCVCDPQGPTLDCSDVTRPSQFHQLVGLQQAPELLKFKSIVIEGSFLPSIPSRAFGQAIAEEYHITGNKYLKAVANGFMNKGSQPTLLQFSNNRLRSFPFSDLKRLEKLQFLILINNELTSIPPRALKDVGENSLVDVVMNKNHIRFIGKEAFAGPKNKINAIVLSENRLERLTSGSLCLDSRPNHFVFGGNNITRVAPDAFGNDRTCGSNFAVQTVLSGNQLRTLPFNDFDWILSKLQEKGSSSIIVSQNPLICDCHMKWLLDEPYDSSVLEGATCTNFQGQPLFSLSPEQLNDCLS